MALILAEEWGIPPWEVEDEAPAFWIDVWSKWQRAKATARQRSENKMKAKQRG